jgi:hypothetical protein
MHIEEKPRKALTHNVKVVTKLFSIATMVISLVIFSIDSRIGVSPCFPVIMMKEDYDSCNIISKKLIFLYPLSSSSFFSFSSKNKKLVHSSIRMEEEVFQLLQKEAERQGISVNSLINKTVKNYVISEMYFEQLGFLLVSKDFLRKTFAEFQDENRLEELGKELGVTVAKEYLSYFFPKVDSDTLAQFLDIWFQRFQSFKHRVDNNYNNNKNKNTNIIIENNRIEGNEAQLQREKEEIHYFTLNHDINLNFSIILKAILEGLIEPLIKSPITFKEITANSISFSFSVISLYNNKIYHL